MRFRPAAALAALLVAGSASDVQAQAFFASAPHPEFMVGPLTVRANVTPKVGNIEVDLFFSFALAAGRSSAEQRQDVFLLWPGAVVAVSGLGGPDPALKATVEQQGFTALEEGRVQLETINMSPQRRGDGRRSREAVAGGAPFVTFVREGGALGLTSPATYLRIPWSEKNMDQSWLLHLKLVSQGLVKPKPSTWLERALWGDRHRLTLSFHDVRQRVLFPMYFWQRDRVVRLSEDPSQLVANFKNADQLKIDEMFPQSARRQRSETLENTEVVSTFLDPSEGLRPQTLSVQFGYFFGWQAWAPVLIPILFFALGNLAGPLVRFTAQRIGRTLAARVHFGRGHPDGPSRDSGVVLSRETLARIVPGETRYDEVIRLAGGPPEEQEKLTAPDTKLLVYRGRRIVPHRTRTFGWIATVDHWDVEHHEVEIALEREVVSDVQARVRRTRLAYPEG